jgi:DNA gyrase inhibitor GyrI
MTTILSMMPDIVRPPCPFLYIEKRGSLEKTASAAWEEFVWRTKGRIDEAAVEAGASLMRIDREQDGDAAFIYQAGLLLTRPPGCVPEGFALRTLQAGRYAGFLFVGSYRQLAKAHDKARRLLEARGVRRCDDFIIEKYLNKSSVTPEHELKTAILFPVAED